MGISLHSDFHTTGNYSVSHSAGCCPLHITAVVIYSGEGVLLRTHRMMGQPEVGYPFVYTVVWEREAVLPPLSSFHTQDSCGVCRGSHLLGLGAHDHDGPSVVQAGQSRLEVVLL